MIGSIPSGSDQEREMSAAGSEFALRIALCDLVERLKRSEQMCKYLERCRNELAKEFDSCQTREPNNFKGKLHDGCIA